MKQFQTGFMMAMLMSAFSLSFASQEVTSENDKINYSIGYQLGNDLKKQGITFSQESLVQGIRDALSGGASLISHEQMSAKLIELKRQIVADQQHEEKKNLSEYRKASAAFLAENAKQDGVTVMRSGVQYKILKPGSGRKPTLDDEVRVHYRISQVDGKEVASTYVGGKPRSYPMAKATPGLQEVLTLMSEGAKWQIVLPTGAATGGREIMDEMGTMVYEMELLSVIPGTFTSQGADMMNKQKK